MFNRQSRDKLKAKSRPREHEPRKRGKGQCKIQVFPKIAMALPWTTRTFTARGATGVGEAMYPPKLHKNGSSTEDTSRPVVRTKTRKGALLFEKKNSSILSQLPKTTGGTKTHEPCHGAWNRSFLVRGLLVNLF